MSDTSNFPQIYLTPLARARLEELEAARHSRHVLVMQSCCAAPSVVRAVPARDFNPEGRQTQVAVLWQHAIWADKVDLQTCPHGSLIIVPVGAQGGAVGFVARRDDPEGCRRS